MTHGLQIASCWLGISYLLLLLVLPRPCLAHKAGKQTKQTKQTKRTKQTKHAFAFAFLGMHPSVLRLAVTVSHAPTHAPTVRVFAGFVCRRRARTSLLNISICNYSSFNSSFYNYNYAKPRRQTQIARQIVRSMAQGVTVADGCLVNQNPATGELISKVACTTAAELEHRLALATKAQVAWGQMNARHRVDLLRQGLTKLGTQRHALSRLMVQEMGKPLAQAKAEMEGAVAKDDYLDVLVQALEPKEHGTSLVVRQPYGVVAILSPWNFPADEILLLALPALGSGNTVVVKPSEVAPETGQMVVETLASVLPAGVLQVVQGDGVVGERLVQHPSTKLIAMTGSSATGKKIAAQAALGLKRLVLELGGKDPMVVLADADVEAAAADAVAFSLDNTGQVCCSIERIYVAESIYDNFVKAVQRHAATHKVGDGLDEGVTVGPLVSSRQRSHVQVQVDDALAKGARLVYQSELPSDAPAEASFFPVTVLSRVTRDMLIATEETFGPVVCLTPFDGSEETAVSLANDSVYGLAAAVYSQDVTKAQRVASQIQAGQVGINCYAPAHMDVACPWVGHKESGLGYHSGVEGFHNFSIPKSLVFRPS